MAAPPKPCRRCPGSPVICTGNSSNLDAFVSTDQRGFARLNTTYTGYSDSNPCLDAGAVQTNYQSIQFDSGTYQGIPGQAVNPAPVVSVTESGQSMGGIPVTLGFNGTAPTTSSGLGPVTTVAGTGAEFDSLIASPLGSYTLTTSLTVVGSDSISDTATLNIGASPTISTTPNATGVTLGSTPTDANGYGRPRGRLIPREPSLSLSTGQQPRGHRDGERQWQRNLFDADRLHAAFHRGGGGNLPWNASYSGDSNNNPAQRQNNADEQVTVSPASPTISTSPSPGVTLGTGAPPLRDMAMLSAGANPTGTITFTLLPGRHPGRYRVGEREWQRNVFDAYRLHAAYDGDGNGYLPVECGLQRRRQQ